MNDQQTTNEAACGGSALTAELGALADQFECHALSRSIDDVEAAGRAMRAAKAEIERMRKELTQAPIEKRTLPNGETVQVALVLVPNACGEPGLTEPGKD